MVLGGKAIGSSDMERSEQTTATWQEKIQI